MSDGSNVPLISTSPASGWRRENTGQTLAEAHRSIAVPVSAGFWRKLLAFSGPGYLVAVGYMDPGNWASDIGSGSAFGYTLLSVIMLSNLMAILLQALSARLGIATGRDLAQACRDHYSKPVAMGLWVMCEIAICACDLAEVIGTAIALNLLFHLPIVWGVLITSLDVLIVLWLGRHGFRWLETLVVSLVLLIGLCFGLEVFFSHPAIKPLLMGFIPQVAIIHDPKMLFLAISIIGSTVMPHNLYLHSSIVQTRKYEQNTAGKHEAIQYASIDSFLALVFAFFINAAILVVAAATFHVRGHTDVAEIQDAHRLLSPMLGVGIAGVVFAVALLASGQNSTLTGTLAGQIVMEGFINFRMRPWLRRLITRLLAIVPAAIAAGYYGDRGTSDLLLISQVILSMQLPFAVIPLVLFTSDRRKMGAFASPVWLQILAWITTVIILGLDLKLIWDQFAS